MFPLLLALLLSPIAKNPGGSWCGTSLERTAQTIALDQYLIRKFGFPATTETFPVSTDLGNIAVIEDDGALITHPNIFDLSGTSLTFTPAGAAYSVARSTLDIDSGAGTAATQVLDDDDSVGIPLPFPFTYFGKSYASVFLNSDGNLTFEAPDSASIERDLPRMIAGSPRIAPLLADLNPVSPARVTVEALSDRVIFTWINVGEWVTGGSRGRNTFQAVLFSSGVIRFTYQNIDARQVIVGISPGGGTSTIDLIDLSAQITDTPFPGLVAEVFATTESVSLAAVSQYFYRSHPDVYDSLMIFSDFNLTLDNAFAFTIGIRNDVSGIITEGEPLYDRGRQFGSIRRLEAMSNMGSLAQYPSDPRRRFLGENNTLAVLSHEFGHRWLAFMDTRDGILLGRQRAHWSYFNNTSGSVMEGNEILDLGGGRFRTVGATYRYSPLDQYIMGLRPASEVPPWFVVTEPRIDNLPSAFTSGCREAGLAACSPYVGLEFSGNRRDVTVEEMIGIAGPRAPTVATARKEFRVAFILLTQRGQAVQLSSVRKLDDIRTAWEGYFKTAVDGRGSLRTDLMPLASTSSSVEGNIAVNGMRRIETAAIESTTQVGYARVDSAFGVSVFRSRNGSQVVSEAAVPAASAGTSFMVYAEKTSSASTGLAIVNPGTSPSSVTITLSSGAQTTLTLPAGAQTAKFIDEIFTNLGTNFSGTASIRANTPIAVTALRGTVNEANAFLITAVPLSDSTIPASEVTVFPQIADGAGYSTELILINPAEARITGNLDFSFSVVTDRGSGLRFTYDIPPRGAWRLRTTNTGSQVQVGYASVTPTTGMSRPVSSAIFSLVSGGILRFQAGVPSQAALTRAVMFGSREANQRSVAAIANTNDQPATMHLTAYDADGGLLATTTLSIASNGHIAAFIDELLPGLPANFQGTIALASATRVYAITLRSLLTADAFIMTPMPMVDLNSPPAGTTYFPQLADGGNFTTEILLLNVGASAFRLQFFGADGLPLQLGLK